MRPHLFALAAVLFSGLSCSLFAQPHPAPLGAFENHTDLGASLHPGSATYDAAANTYTLTGSGDNMWFAEDDFHFAWK